MSMAENIRSFLSVSYTFLIGLPTNVSLGADMDVYLFAVLFFIVNVPVAADMMMRMIMMMMICLDHSCGT